MHNYLSRRIIELELYLLAHRRTQRQIADHFGVDRKTVRRAIDRLGQTAMVGEEKEGRHTVYFIQENDFNASQLTPTELAALVLAQEAISAGENFSGFSPFAEAGGSLVHKVRAKMPPRIRHNLDELSKILGTAAVSNKNYSEFGETIEELMTAAMERRTVTMCYESLSSSRRAQRLFDPYNIYFDPDGATLKTIGYDHLNARISPFSVDRIKSIILTKETFVQLANYELRKYLSENCFNGIHGTPITVQIKCFGVTAAVFAERKFHYSQRTIALKTSKQKKIEEIIIEMRVAGGRGLERFILSWLPDIQVIAPENLRLKIKQIIGQAKF